MHLWRLWFALGLFASFAAVAAVVYKWTDADGVVHFSDQPVPGAEKIVTSSGTNNGVTAGARSGPAAELKAIPGTGLDYAKLTIESPASEQVFFGDEIVPVRLHLEPELQPNHSITWHLNGKQLDDQANTESFTLQALPRGTYAVAATVTDAVTGNSKSTESVTFYVRQPSELSPQHQKP
jgi:hypothetical protein